MTDKTITNLDEVLTTTGTDVFPVDVLVGGSPVTKKMSFTTLSGSFALSSKGVTNGDTHDHNGGDGAQINHTTLSNIGTNTHATIDTHLASTSNPHSTTASQVGAIPSVSATTVGAVLTSNGSAWTNTGDIVNPTIKNFVETLYAPSAGSSFTVDLANGTLQKFTTNANCSIALPTSVAGKSYTIIVSYGGTHTLAFTGGSTLKWAGGSAPTATSTSGKLDIYVFTCDGTNTYGADAGRNY